MNLIKIKKYIFFLLIGSCAFLPQKSFSQIKQYRFEQLDSLQKTERKPVAIFLHTSWCKYCGTMKNTTFKNVEIVKVLNQKFYFISLNIEEKHNIRFRGHTFKYKPTGVNTGEHELAKQLGTINGQVSYPAICFMNADYEIVYQQEGYIPSQKLVFILNKLAAGK